MTNPVPLRTDGPHSPEYTRQLGEVFAESARCLNYATLGEAPGLGRVQDAYSLLADVYIGTGRLPQLCGQIAGFLGRQEGLGDDAGRDAAAQVALAVRHLGAAHGFALQMTEAMQDAQVAISGLYVKDGDDDA